MRIYLLALAALGLAACQPSADPNYNINASTPAPTNTVATGDDCGIASNTLLDEKALFAAETAYNIPADAYVRFDAAGKLPPDIKATVRPLLIQAYDYLKLARTAYNAGDGCSLKRYGDLAQAFGNKAKSLLPK